MRGTERAYGPTGSEADAGHRSYQHEGAHYFQIRYQPTRVLGAARYSLRAYRYSCKGYERRAVLTQREVLRDSDGTTRCPVFAQRMVLRHARY
eukprot:2038483-Rhodomonas_salina.5